MFRLCSKCTHRMYEQFFEDLSVLDHLQDADEKAVMFIKMSFSRALLASHGHRLFPVTSGSPALQFLKILEADSPSTPLQDAVDAIRGRLRKKQNRRLYRKFPSRDMVIDTFREQLEGRKRITYRLSNGVTVITDKKLHGEEMLLPYNISHSSDKKEKYFHNYARGISRRDLKHADILRVDDTLLSVKNAVSAEFAHHTIMLIIDYLFHLMSFDDVFNRLRPHFDGEEYRSLCINCRDHLKQLGWHKSRSYENECLMQNSCLLAFDIVLCFYLARAASITVCDLDSMGVAAEYMSTLQVCRGCMDRGIIPGDDECFY